MAKRTAHQTAIDDALTRYLNGHDAVHDFLAACTARLSRELRTSTDVCFYLKGSTALRRYLRRNHVPDSVVDEISARSDWDTQLLINPGLPRARWFAVYLQCQTIIQRCLDDFEERLLGVLARTLGLGDQVHDDPLGGEPDGPDPRQQRALLAGRVREALSARFAWVLITTAVQQRFHMSGDPAFWDLRWGNITELVWDARQHEILDLDVQTHSRATLTSALIHPTQALSTLASIMPETALRRLTDTTAVRAEESWQRMSEICDEYDRLQLQYIQQNPDLVAFVLREVQRLQPGLDGVTGLDDHRIDEETLAAVTAANHERIIKKLSSGEVQKLAELQDRITAEFERYHELPDPEDVAEAEREDLQVVAPFAVVPIDRGTRDIGSILENMTIADFYLFRLMIRAQISDRGRAPGEHLLPDSPLGTPRPQFAFRAELLDISVPREDSIETAEEWAHTRARVTVDESGLPLPDGEYFLDEYIRMFREALDEKSSSSHKFEKRLRRACEIAAVHARELRAADAFEPRVLRLADDSPAFLSLSSEPAHSTANILVVMRMFEQLRTSYDLEYDHKLAMDFAVMVRAWDAELRAALRSELTPTVFEQLMRIYGTLGRTLYNHQFVLAAYRRRLFDDDRLAGAAQQVVRGLRDEFGDNPARIRCAVVGDFAIAAEPDLPPELRQDLPLNVLTILVHTTAADRRRVRSTVDRLAEVIRALAPGRIDTVDAVDTVYFRVDQQSDSVPDELRGQAGAGLGKAVFGKIEIVDDPDVEWVVPAHERDLRTIVRQYRRSLPRYTEYQALARRKDILRRLERALTTY
jgi:hypothetical protein